MAGDHKLTQWERRHANGWIATVRPGGPDAYVCFVYTDLVIRNASWACIGLQDLTGAQDIADAHVPAHRCDCPPWDMVTLW